MAFNPSIPPPRPVDLSKVIKGRHVYINDELEAFTKDVIRQPIEGGNLFLNFHKEIRKNLKEAK